MNNQWCYYITSSPCQELFKKPDKFRLLKVRSTQMQATSIQIFKMPWAMVVYSDGLSLFQSEMK